MPSAKWGDKRGPVFEIGFPSFNLSPRPVIGLIAGALSLVCAPGCQLAIDPIDEYKNAASLLCFCAIQASSFLSYLCIFPDSVDQVPCRSLALFIRSFTMHFLQNSLIAAAMGAALVAAAPAADLDARSSCTFTSASAAKSGASKCSTVTLKGIQVPAGETLDLTGLKSGATVHSSPFPRRLIDLGLSNGGAGYL